MTGDIDILNRRYGSLEAADLIAAMTGDAFPGRIALVSSFGAEAAVLLHMVAAVDRLTPVIFLDTGKLFGETRRYRDDLIRHLGLGDVRTVTPLAENERALDPDGMLWAADPNRCCYFRKVLPLQRALESFDASITGRKRYQGGGRGALPIFEWADGRIRINPLAGWDKGRIKAYFATHALPRHPLEADGFTSIGCMPCTERAAPGDSARAGRWRGQAKTECGIHLPPAERTPTTLLRRPSTSAGC